MEQDLTPPSLPANDVASSQALFGQRDHARQHFVTKGEKKFDRMTYTTVGYIINALLSVVAVAAVERTQGGQKMMENFRGWAERNLKFAKPETAKMLATKSFFLAGGFAVLAPMKWLEDAKVNLVKKWNREYYGNAVDTDPNLIQSHKDLEAAPKQTWGSVLSSRILALVPFYAGYWLLWDKKSPLSKATGEKIFIDKPIVAVSRGIGKVAAEITGNKAAAETIAELNKTHAGEMLSELPNAAERARKPHDPVHSTGAYYFISEAITSGMVAWGVYALTRVLGPLMGKKQQAAPEAKLEPVVVATPPIDKKLEERPAAEKKIEERPQVEEHAQRPEIKAPEHRDAHHAKTAHESQAPHHKAPDDGETPQNKVHHVQHERHHEAHHAQTI